MKLAMRPKNRPIGVTQATASVKEKKASPRWRVNSHMAMVTPSNPPWNDMPPCQTFRICAGFSM